MDVPDVLPGFTWDLPGSLRMSALAAVVLIVLLLPRLGRGSVLVSVIAAAALASRLAALGLFASWLRRAGAPPVLIVAEPTLPDLSELVTAHYGYAAAVALLLCILMAALSVVVRASVISRAMTVALAAWWLSSEPAVGRLAVEPRVVAIAARVRSVSLAMASAAAVTTLPHAPAALTGIVSRWAPFSLPAVPAVDAGQDGAGPPAG